MSFPFDTTGINPDQGPILPDGWYKFEIIEADELGKDGGPRMSKKGYRMVNCTCLVVDDPRYPNSRVFHNVTFIPKGMPGEGMAVHFLKSIGEPWEGQVEISPEHWVFGKRRFMGKVGKREYNGKIYSQITEIAPVRDAVPPLQEPTAVGTDEDIPF